MNPAAQLQPDSAQPDTAQTGTAQPAHPRGWNRRTPAGPGPGQQRGRMRLGWGDAVAAGAAIAVGLFGAVCYYSDTLRPLAHTYSIWILLVAVIAANHTPLRGAVRGAAGLALSVVAFYYGKQLMYDILYGTDGLPYRVSADELLLWGTLGIVGGAGLGTIVSTIGRTGWLAAGGSATVTALLAVEAYQRYSDYREALPAAVAVAGTLTVIVLGDHTPRQLLRTAYALIPAAAAVIFILIAPDWIQTTLRI